MKIRLVNLKKKYRDRVVLNIDNLELKGNRIYSILGPNGSGKSTMLKILAGIDKNFTGSVFYNEKSYSEHPITYMPQKPYQFDLTVLDNVLLGADGKADSKIMAIRALTNVGMELFINEKMNSLSGGESQRIALARSLIADTPMMFLDEPASMVDIISLKKIENCIRKASNENAKLIVFTTHNPSQAYRLADEVLILWNGNIIEFGTSENVLKNTTNEDAKAFLEDWRL